MATLKMTTGAVLDTVTESAAAVSNIVKSVGAGASMLHSYVDYQRYIQLKNIQLDKQFVKQRTIAAKTLELDQILDAAETYINADARRAERCKEIQKQLEEAWGE